MNKYSNPTKKIPSAPKFTVYDGVFPCQKCKVDVDKARFWKDTFDFTWMCECRFVSKVNLYGRGY